MRIEEAFAEYESKYIVGAVGWIGENDGISLIGFGRENGCSLWYASDGISWTPTLEQLAGEWYTGWKVGRYVPDKIFRIGNISEAAMGAIRADGGLKSQSGILLMPGENGMLMEIIEGGKAVRPWVPSAMDIITEDWDVVEKQAIPENPEAIQRSGSIIDTLFRRGRLKFR